MDFRLNEDQAALKRSVDAFLEERAPLDHLRKLETEVGFDRALWSSIAEMGVFSLRLSEEKGGAGLGAADAALVFEALGQKLIPGPLIFTHLAAPLFSGAAKGEVVVGGLDLPEASPTPLLVEHFASLDVLLLLRRDGVERLDPRTVDARPVALPLDPLTPVHALVGTPRGEKIGGPEDALRLRLAGTLLASAMMLGIAEASQSLATQYAKDRKQFDRPIGSFQVIKHILADMFVRQELARAQVYAGGATLDDPGVGDPERAISSARITAGEAALKNTKGAIQVYGGMGYTWEIPIHYYLKRAWVLDSMFGTSESHAERIAGGLVGPARRS